ncbi:MAG: hypothetical protein HEQ37_06450 [Acidovorax sp.]|nr:hypothetical protein [Acidovorax sp.]
MTYASNNANCTISGTTLTAAAVGTCTVTATKAADTNYAAATSAGITVTVSQATQATLVAVSTPSTVAFGGTTTLSTTGGSGTGAVTYASTNANCTISGTTLTAAAVGTCTVTATKAADTNYAAATSAGITVTVSQATQATLVAVSTPSTVAFGGTTTLSTTGGSGTGAVTYASTNANCTISGTTLTAAAVGTCTVTATKAADSNYAVATATVNISVAATVPGAPTIGTAIAGDTQASVAFTAPANIGGSPITSYIVTVIPPDVAPVTGASSPIVVTGLTNGQAYAFRVTAENVAGVGPASAASNSITPKAIQTITFAEPGRPELRHHAHSCGNSRLRPDSGLHVLHTGCVHHQLGWRPYVCGGGRLHHQC